jgi:hypothetical protein
MPVPRRTPLSLSLGQALRTSGCNRLIVMKLSFLLFIVAFVLPEVAFGLGGAIRSPRLGFPDNTPPEAIKKVMDTLNGDFTFVDGGFINEITSQRFTSPVKKLGALIVLLHDAHFKLRLAFAELKSESVTFEIFQDAHQMQNVVITINTASKLAICLT